MIWPEIILLVTLAVATSLNIYERHKARQLYNQLKKDKDVYDNRLKELVLELWYISSDPRRTKDELSDFLQDLYHQLDGNNIIKNIKT